LPKLMEFRSLTALEVANVPLVLVPYVEDQRRLLPLLIKHAVPRLRIWEGRGGTVDKWQKRKSSLWGTVNKRQKRKSCYGGL
jgi:hypothetical protein